MTSTARNAAAPRVSVVVPTKDRAPLLDATLHSIRSQRDVTFEVVVVDDGSRDPTLVSRAVARCGDPRLRVVRHHRSRGVSEARNRGITEARAEWVAFCDDDDLWSPDKLAAQLAAAEATGRSWVYAGSVNVSAGGRVVGGSPPPSPERVAEGLPQSNVVPGGCSSVLVAAWVLAAAGPFDPQLGPGADWDLWLRLLRTGPPACVPSPLVAYRVHAGNMSLDSGRMEADFRLLAARYGTMSHAIFYRYMGWWSLRARRRRTALSYLAKAAGYRSRDYPAAAFLSDVSYLAREAAEVARQRYAARLLRRSFLPQPAQEHPDYLARAEAWLGALNA